MLPDIFSAQTYVSAVGSGYNKYISAFDVDDPATPAFQLKQLSQFLQYGTVITAVYDDSTTPFDLTFDNTNKEFNLSQGTVRSKENDYVISAQTFKYSPAFAQYNPSDYYIATIFVDVVSLDSNNLKTLTVSQPIVAGADEIYVREKTILSQIKAPCKVQISNTLYQVGTIDLYAGKLIFSSSSPTVSTNVAVDTKIFIIQQPIISCVYTNPFEINGDAFLANHINKALLPKNSLRLYDILMTNPGSPQLVTTSGIDQVKTCFVNFKGQTFDETSAQNLYNAINAFNFSISQAQNALDINTAIANFNAATEQLTQSGTISDYWLNTIMLQPEIIAVGVDLGRYKKFDFPQEYIEAAYDIANFNYYELIGAFDPNYYSYTNIYSGNTTVPNLTVDLLEDYGPVSMAMPGLITHGVSSTVSTEYPSGETPVNYITSNLAASSSLNAAFELRFTPVDYNSYDYYNLYRKGIYNEKSIDVQLVEPLEVKGDPNFGYNFLPQSPVSGSSYAGFSGTYTILNTNNSYNKFAVKFQPRLVDGSQAQSIFVGGVALDMSAGTSYSGSASIQAKLVVANPDLNTYILLGSSDLMPINKFASYNSAQTEFSFKFNQSISGSLNLTNNDNYYIIFELNNPDSTNFPITGYTAGAPAVNIAQIYSGSAWSNISNTAFKFRTLGVVDNLNASGSIINTTLPTSGYTFRGVRQIRSSLVKPKKIYAYVPYFKISASGEKQATYLQNELLVRVVGVNSTTGETIDTGYISVPKNTSSGNKVAITFGNQRIDRIAYMSVSPGTDISTDSNGQIVWGANDYILIIGDE